MTAQMPAQGCMPVPQPAQMPYPVQQSAQMTAQMPYVPQVSQPAPTQMDKQMIGEKLYPRIQEREPKFAGKITGMFLEMEPKELSILLENDVALDAKIKEAKALICAHIQ